jgi:hypothetical protein
MCAVELLQNIEIWIFFHRGISRFLNDPDHRNLFNDVVKEIIYKFEETKKSTITYEKGKLFYSLNSSLEMFEENGKTTSILTL